MRLIQLALIFSLLVTASSCAFLTPKPVPVDIKTTAIERAPLNLPDSDPISLAPVDWTVITKDNAADVWVKLGKLGKDQVLLGLTDSGYEALTENNQKVMNLLKQQKKIIDSYKKYYEPKTK